VNHDRDDRRLIAKLLVFVVLCIIVGGLWPWLLR
jgi:hypothetical protein